MWSLRLLIVASALVQICVGLGVPKTITVDAAGKGQFKTIQAAVDSVPSNNKQWVRILVKCGVYSEQVRIGKDKHFILLEGEKAESTSVEALAAGGDTAATATFSIEGDNFVARRITFKNIFNRPYDIKTKSPMKQAVALQVSGDKAAFFYCHFIGFQDTLSDLRGRHYFYNCFIEGSVDFIFGMGQSIYENCKLRFITEHNDLRVPVAYITANGRDDPKDPTGFMFKNCHVFGEGAAYLGRAWGDDARVIFYNTKMSGAIVPEGWDAWNHKGKEGQITFVEDGCTGEGANMAKRVPWMKKLSPEELSFFTSITFVDKEGWLKQVP